MWKRVPGDGNERQDDQCREDHQHDCAASVVNPFAHAEADYRNVNEQRDHADTGERDHEFVRRDPGAARPKRISNVRRELQAGFGGVGHGEEPEIPSDEKSDCFIESKLRPLIQTAFEWHQAIEVNDDDC